MSFFNTNGRVDSEGVTGAPVTSSNFKPTLEPSDEVIERLFTEGEVRASIEELFDEMRIYRIRREKDMDDSMKFAKLYICK